ncbi:hypothetical protein H5410_040809 [Solanum commersonii]|uniref:Uncharacterized protein n=1 Tax=Solanum commersonii TaxID=4109 RepID=A0A9J5XRX2_SOLCO|nr:hypothetical protein H5410_040809 [Solanum commersonii]
MCLVSFSIFRFAAYGATKRSVVHLTKSLQAELEMQDVKNVLVHNLSPGMVTTDLLMSGANTKQAKFFINVLAEPADVVKSFTRNSLNEYEICRVLTRTTLVLFPVASSMLLFLQVAEYLVPNIRSIPTNGSTKATYIRFLTGLKAYSQIFSVKWSTFAPLISGLRLVLDGIDMFLKIDAMGPNGWIGVVIRTSAISCFYITEIMHGPVHAILLPAKILSSPSKKLFASMNKKIRR